MCCQGRANAVHLVKTSPDKFVKVFRACRWEFGRLNTSELVFVCLEMAQHLDVTESWRKLGLGSLSLRSTLVNEAERFDL
jgi:hypothetical protein